MRKNIRNETRKQNRERKEKERRKEKEKPIKIFLERDEKEVCFVLR